MAVQVAQAADPSTNPAAASAYKNEMLSPVSKLEAARKQAALEQQKRVEEAVARMASVKSENAGKRKLLEEKLDAHAKVKVQKTSAATSTRAESKRSVAVAASATSSMSTSTSTTSAFVASATQAQKQQQVVEAVSTTATVATKVVESTVQEPKKVTATTTTVSASYDATAALLRATRSKLNDLVNEDAATAEAATTEAATTETAKAEDGEWDGPSTNYHLKQLGLVKKKIDIYAPVEVQQREIRRLRDRSRMSSSTIIDDAAADDLDSENDLDFTPGVESENDDEDSDAESIPEVEAEETLELVRETAEHERKLQQKALLTKIPLAVLLFCVALVVVLATVDFAQQQLHFCAVDADSDSLCGSFLQTRASIASVVQDASASVHECVAASVDAVRAWCGPEEL